MTEPNPTPASPTVLAYHERRAYRPSGKMEIGGFLIALAGGFLAAALSAVVVWGWMLFVEKGLIFGAIAPLIGQGIIVGAALFYLFRRAKLRNAPLAISIGLMCAVFSALCFQGAIYLHSVHRAERRFRLDLADEGFKPDSPQMKFAEALMARPFDFYDRVMLLPKTGRRGFPAFLRLRLSEAGGWIAFQVLALTITAGLLGWQASNRPFCETCNAWYHDPFTAVSLKQKWAEPLVQAVGADDPSQVLGALQAAADDPGSGIVRVRCKVHRCPKCKGCLAELHLTNQGKNNDKSRRLAPLQRISEETVTALKTEMTPTAADA